MNQSKSPPSLVILGMPVKYLVLLMLILQNSSNTLAVRYSLAVQKEVYSFSTVVVMVELMKMLVSMVMIHRQKSATVSSLDIYASLTINSLPMCVPALVYFAQKLCSFVGLQNLDPAVYAIVTQLKMLTTALFSVTMLGRDIPMVKWRALLLLVVGVCIINLASQNATDKHQQVHNNSIGLIAALGVACLSGFAGVYIEKSIKTGHLTIWDRNYQLSLYGLY